MSHLSWTPAQCHCPPAPTRPSGLSTKHIPHLKERGERFGKGWTTGMHTFMSSRGRLYIMVIKVKQNASHVRRLLKSAKLRTGHKRKPPMSLTSPHTNTADVLLSQEVPDLNQSSVLLNDNVDGEMGIHRAHLVPETLGGETCTSDDELREDVKHVSSGAMNKNNYKFRS